MKYILILLFITIFANAQEDTNISIISLERDYLLFRGVNNPIKIAVPGALSFKAEAYRLKKTGQSR